MTALHRWWRPRISVGRAVRVGRIDPLRGVVACSLALATLCPFPLLAQQPDTVQAGERQDSAAVRPVQLDPLVVSASRRPIRQRESGLALSVIAPEELELTKPLYAIDPLRNVPGAHVDEAAGPGGPAIIRLRGGEEVFTQILIDGVRVNQNGGFFDFQGFRLDNLERIEVARGPQSAMLGSGAMSGIVQYLTRRGAVQAPRLELSAEGGAAAENGGSFAGVASVSGGSNRFTYSGAVGTAYSRGFYDVAHDTRTVNASVRLDAAPSSAWALKGTFRVIDMASQLPVRDPGATRVPLDPNARNDRDRIVSALRAAWTPSPRWSHTVTASFYREDFVFEDQRDDVATEVVADFFVFDADFTLDSELTRPSVEYVGSYDLRDDGGTNLSFGGQFERERLEDATGGEFGEDAQTLDRNAVAAFAELQSRAIPRTHVLMGARLEKYQGLSAEVTPRATVRFDIAPSVLSARAAVGGAYRAPNLQQQFLDNPFIASNPDLEPETSTSWEVGLDAASRGGSLSLGVTYFRQRFDNLIRTVAQEGSTQQINRNLGAARAQGVEWVLRYRPVAAWSLGTEGAWVDTEILDNTGLPESEYPNGAELPFRPGVVGALFVETSFREVLSARIRGRVVGEQTVLSERFSGERVDLDPYFVLDLNLTYTVRRRLQLYLRARNLLDAEFETAFDRVGQPLTLAIGARFTTG